MFTLYNDIGIYAKKEISDQNLIDLAVKFHSMEDFVEDKISFRNSLNKISLLETPFSKIQDIQNFHNLIILLPVLTFYLLKNSIDHSEPWVFRNIRRVSAVSHPASKSAPEGIDDFLSVAYDGAGLSISSWHRGERLLSR